MTVNAGLTNFVPIIAQWQLQSDKDIYESFNDWDFHKFLCIMKDGKQIEASGIIDESGSGFCCKYIDFDGDYDVEDLVFWLEIPPRPSLDKLEIYKEDNIKAAIKDYRVQFIKEICDYGRMDN